MSKSGSGLNRSQRRRLERARRRVERRLERGERVEQLDGGRIGVSLRHAWRLVRGGQVIAECGQLETEVNDER